MAKRIFKGLVFFFALYAFVFVPLGKKSALEHMRAIFGTPQAKEAASEVKGGVTRLVRRLQSEARESTEETDRRLDEQYEPPSPDPVEQETRDARPTPKPKLRTLSSETPAPPLR
jgi:hypothetical protein